MAIRNFNVQHGISLGDDDITIVDSNANVLANTLISNNIISTSGTNSNITINPDGTGIIDVSNKKISNLAEPVAASDAATKGYVDATAQGLSIKNSVQYATVGNILLDGSVTSIDDKIVTTGDRVLVKDQTNQAQNGIYIANTTGAWTRSLDMNIATEIYGAFTFVERGTINQSTGWVTTNSPLDPFTLNTTAMTWTQFSGTGTDISTDIDTLHVTGGTTNYVLAAKDNLGNLQYANVANYFLVNTNISTVVAGSTLAFTVDYANTQYPGGIYTLQQLGPVSMSISDQWSISGSNVGTTKNAYANFVATQVNTANVTITFTLANANFSLQTTDTLTIGSTVLNNSSSPNLRTLLSSIDGRSSGTVTIPNTSLNANVNANGLVTVTNAVSVNLTNSRGSTGAGVTTASGTSLVATAPTAYSVNSISGTFPSSSIPYWNLNQTFNWSVATTGTTSAGNLTYSGGAISTTSLSSTGGASGTSGSIDSTSSYTITTNDYYGLGLNGYGNRTIPATVNGTVNAATKYYPLFWKTTATSALPTFTVSDTRNSSNYALGQGAITSTTASNYLWLAIPNLPSNGTGLVSRTFKHVFGGFDIVDTPTVTGTQSIASGGQSYNYSIYGFSGFTTASNIITTS
jgi:hypothetical protein